VSLFHPRAANRISIEHVNVVYEVQNYSRLEKQ